MPLAPCETLLDQLEAVRAGMLGTNTNVQSMQPMTHFLDRGDRVLWFITSRETGLAKDVGSGAMGIYTLVSQDHDFHARIIGPITQHDSSDKLLELWSPLVGAWFEGGIDDPEVLLLKMPMAQAETWASSGTALRIGVELAKATLMSSTKPDLGVHHRFDISSAA